MKPKLEPISEVVRQVMRNIRNLSSKLPKAILFEGICTKCKEWTSVAEPCCFAPVAVPGHGAYTIEDALHRDIDQGLICGCRTCVDDFMEGIRNPCEFDCVERVRDFDPISLDDQGKICEGCKRVLRDIGARFEAFNE